MSRNIIDFQSIGYLEEELIEKLDFFLKTKQEELGQALLASLPEQREYSEYSLDQVASCLTENISFSPKISLQTRQSMIVRMNRAFWIYTEILEACTTALFQQLEQVGCEKWTSKLRGLVEQLQKLLLLRTEEVLHALCSIDSLIQASYRHEQSRLERLKAIFIFWKKELDPKIFSALKHHRKILQARGQLWNKRYRLFEQFLKKSESLIVKFDNFLIFQKFEILQQADYLNLYRLINLWELGLRDRKARVLLDQKIVDALRKICGLEKTVQLLQDYLKQIKVAIFTQSRLLKEKRNEGKIRSIVIYLEKLHSEVISLTVVISKFREFLLRTNPDPYIRSRWGFPEWIVGPEPASTKKIRDLVFEGEATGHLIKKLKAEIISEPQQHVSIKKLQLIQEAIHVMKQPMLESHAMRSEVEKFLIHLEELQELAATDQAIVNFVGQLLLQALNADWRRGFLFEKAQFHQLYEIHTGIIGSIESPQHRHRELLFKEILDRFIQALKNRTLYRQQSLIEKMCHALRVALKNFLEEIKKLKRMNSVCLEKYAQMILCYRYQFGTFYALLDQYEDEGRMLRTALFFVDQYMESIETELGCFQE